MIYVVINKGYKAQRVTNLLLKQNIHPFPVEKNEVLSILKEGDIVVNSKEEHTWQGRFYVTWIEIYRWVRTGEGGKCRRQTLYTKSINDECFPRSWPCPARWRGSDFPDTIDPKIFEGYPLGVPISEEMESTPLLPPHKWE